MEKKNNYLPLNIQLFADTQLSTENITPVLTPDFFNTDDYQLQLQENFIVIFESKDGFDGFELLAASVTLPTRSYETIPVNYANKTINVAGRVSFSNGLKLSYQLKKVQEEVFKIIKLMLKLFL